MVIFYRGGTESVMVENQFKHVALDLKGNAELVYTAMSKHLFYYRQHISKYVLQ
jgi:hypothetical protein